jgi:hypothetical protein
VSVLAHGLGNIQDPILPLWLFYYGAAVVLVVSFVALGALWKQPRLEQPRETPLPDAVQRVLYALRVPIKALSFGVLVLVFLAALLGEESAALNIAPTFVYVHFWLGLVAVSLLFGDVWRVLNPWRAAADGAAWVWNRIAPRWEPIAVYPEARLGRWPAAVLLLAFGALELAYSDPSSPRALALAIALYSWITWIGMLTFGREAWLRNGEAFASYFGLYARVAPLAERGGRIVRRLPLSGLAEPITQPGTIAFIAVMIGTVFFDGFSRTSWWLDRRFDVEEPFALDNPRLAELAGSALNLVGLAAAVLLMGLLFVVAVEIGRRVGRAGTSLGNTFAPTLVPIAAAYVIAHYFSVFVLQGQLGIRLVSDPFGFGWDLFGSADFDDFVGALPPNTIWYVQVASLVVGHVLGLTLAHDRAVALFSGKLATRTQYAMLALMVVYTVGGMWVLSRG